MSVKVVMLMVVWSIASLKVATMFWLSGTPVAPLAGVVNVTIGARVVKLHTKSLASGSSATSLAPVVIVAAKVTLGARLLEGVKVAESVGAS